MLLIAWAECPVYHQRDVNTTSAPTSTPHRNLVGFLSWVTARCNLRLTKLLVHVIHWNKSTCDKNVIFDTHTDTCTHTHKHTHIRSHTRTHAQIHTHTHTHTYKHTQTHIHTHTRTEPDLDSWEAKNSTWQHILALPHTLRLVVAVCCSVLQCVAVCCSVLQCVAVCAYSQNILAQKKNILPA